MEDLIIENPWNTNNLKPPRNHFENSSSHLKKVIKEAICKELSYNKRRNQMYLETVALSKFLGQRRNKYRNDKGFQTIKKVDKAVNRIYELDLQSTLYLIKLNLVDTFVPSKQFHQWLLIRLQSYAKLLDRMNSCCRYSATMLDHRLHTGHNWIEVMIALSMVSRIWAISKFLLKQLCSTYQQLYSVFDQLPVDTKEKKWPYNEYKLPQNLLEWLSPNDYDVTLNEPPAAVPDDLQHVEKDAKLEIIMKIESYLHLKRFLVMETKKRSKSETRSSCFSKNLDNLQWQMFTNKIKKWVYKLKKSDYQCRQELMKKIKIKIITMLV